MQALRRRLAVARGDAPADLVVRGASVLSVFTKEWLEADVAIVDGVVAGLGDYEGRELLDASGKFVVPGFVDAHMHLASELAEVSFNAENRLWDTAEAPAEGDGPVVYTDPRPPVGIITLTLAR